jgi:hypothetical protein
LQRLGEREAVGVDVVGCITGSGRITVSAHVDTDQGTQQQERVYVDLPLDPLLGHRTQRVFDLSTSSLQDKGTGEEKGPLPVLSGASLWGALEGVLAQVAVGSKGFLVHKVCWRTANLCFERWSGWTGQASCGLRRAVWLCCVPRWTAV